ncbi:hypothetical protein [Deinococcus pimensis]|uniref:hypothetical protein n=1 Tax=Deinococcus pimensis TaxID=309888 RepID=UPI000489B234|nr:hypothetical protein [Deinococcus pimensis]
MDTIGETFASPSFWVVTVLFGAVLSIAANLVTDALKNAYARRSQQQRQRRLTELRDDLAATIRLKSDPMRFQGVIGRQILLVIAMFALGGAAGALGSLPLFGLLDFVTSGLSAFGYITAITFAFKAVTIINDVLDFDEYETRTKQQIQRLETP